MRPSIRPIVPFAAAALIASAGLTGCVISVKGDVSNWSPPPSAPSYKQADLDAMTDTINRLDIGATTDQVVASFDERVLRRVQSDLQETESGDSYRIELWRLAANHKWSDDGINRWLYFIDGRLALISDDRKDEPDETLVQSFLSEYQN